jgi:hypothetical protein
VARPPSSPRRPVQCEGCSALIWFKLVAGPGPRPLLIPLRAAPDPAGTVAACPGRDWQHGRFLAAGQEPDTAAGEERWRNHFDDCDRKEAFRRRQRDRIAKASRPHGAVQQPSLFPAPEGTQ